MNYLNEHLQLRKTDFNDVAIEQNIRYFKVFFMTIYFQCFQRHSNITFHEKAIKHLIKLIKCRHQQFNRNNRLNVIVARFKNSLS